MRRAVSITSLITLIAIGLVGPSGAAPRAIDDRSDHRDHRHESPTRTTDRAAGMVYRGLTVNPSGPCGELFQINTGAGPMLCTHGPDPAPPSIDVRTRRPRLLQETTTGPTAPIPCDGDGTSGPRVQAIYARTSSTPDRYGQVVDSIRRWAQAVEGTVQMSAAKTGGTRSLRWVTDATSSGCELNVDNVVLGPGGDASFRDTIDEMYVQGFVRSDRRYLIWMDADVLCGQGSSVMDDDPGSSNLNSAGIPLFARIDTGCWGMLDQFQTGPDALSVEAHEVMHNFGAVQASAPHATPEGHCYDEFEVMCYDDDNDPGSYPLEEICPRSHRALFDCNNDDYFHTDPPPGSYLSTHWNSANSILFTGSPFPHSQKLDVNTPGGGKGTVTADDHFVLQVGWQCEAEGRDCPWIDEVADLGLACPSLCSLDLASNMTVRLTATPAAGSTFGQFLGDCLGHSRTYENPDGGPRIAECTIRMDEARSVTASFRGPKPRPDLTVDQDGALLGDDIYNSTGQGQSPSKEVTTGQAATFDLLLWNDSTKTDSLKLKGSRGTSKFSVKYSVLGRDITYDIVNGLYKINQLGAERGTPFRVTIKPKAAATPGDSIAVKMTGTSLRDGTVDVVKAIAKRI